MSDHSSVTLRQRLSFTSTVLALILSLETAFAAPPQFEVLHQFDLAPKMAGLLGRLAKDNAGNLYGASSNTIYKIDSTGKLSAIDYYPQADVRQTVGPVLGDDGKIYGMTENGLSGVGDIVQLDMSGAVPVRNIVQHFDGDNGLSPNVLINGHNGRLFGTTLKGGYGYGVVFELDIRGGTAVFSILHRFTDPSSGSHPSALVQGKNGNLYGVADSGGNPGSVLFQIDLSAPTPIYKVLFETPSMTADHLVLGSRSNIYGVAQLADGQNQLFEINFSATNPVFNTLFTSGQPIQDLVASSDGNLYGTTCPDAGAGKATFFRLGLSAANLGATVLYQFEPISPANFSCPGKGSLTQNDQGRFYGTLLHASPFYGKVYELDISKQIPAFKILFDYNKVDQSYNPSALIQGNSGMLYGGTLTDGEFWPGTVFSLNLAAKPYVYTLLYASYDFGVDYLTKTWDGNIYGIGEHNITLVYENLFQIVDSGNAPSYRFLTNIGGFNADLSRPRGLAKATDGKLYGAFTLGGGYPFDDPPSPPVGSIYQVDLSGPTPVYTSKTYKFDAINGAYPAGSPIQASDGKFYGTTTQGGQFGKGVIYQLDVSSQPISYRVLHSFNGSAGSFEGVPLGKGGNLIGGLTEAQNGRLYGLTNRGGAADKGLVFELDLASPDPTYRIIHEFSGTDGANPMGNLVLAKDGKLYGNTLNGGRNDAGVVFQLDLSTSPIVTVLHTFDANVGHPNNLLVGIDNNLYGIVGGLIYRLIMPTANNPPVAENDHYLFKLKGNDKKIIKVAPPGLLANDKDPEGKALSVLLDESSAKSKTIDLGNNGGKAYLFSNGGFNYLPPNKCFFVNRSFSYQASDGAQASAPATVSIAISCRKPEKREH